LELALFVQETAHDGANIIANMLCLDRSAAEGVGVNKVLKFILSEVKTIVAAVFSLCEEGKVGVLDTQGRTGIP
tara:strand:+ start:7681 stop:7902 length:222 start_codon:yes stop_codon:yes gene_type:complete